MGIERVSNSAADLGGPLKAEFGGLGSAATRSPLPKIELQKPAVAPGTAETTRGWLVPGKDIAPAAPVDRTVVVPFGDGQAVFVGDLGKVTAAEAAIPLGRRGGVSVNGLAGTSGGTSSVLGASVQVDMFSDALSLGAEYRISEPNDGTQTGSRDLSLSAVAKLGKVELNAAVAVGNPRTADDRSTSYSLGTRVPLAGDAKINLSGAYTQGASADKDRYTVTGGVVWPNKGIEVRLDTGLAETQVQVQARLDF